ncbi:hypothetical protein [Mycobacterium syngnathidarum]
MSEPPTPVKPEQIEVTVHWPTDTYKNAKPANLFVFTDNGDSVCLSLGFMPPPPNVKELAAAAEGQVLHFEVEQRDAFVVSRQMLVKMQQELTQFISANSHLFVGMVSQSDTNAPPA